MKIQKKCFVSSHFSHWTGLTHPKIKVAKELLSPSPLSSQNPLLSLPLLNSDLSCTLLCSEPLPFWGEDSPVLNYCTTSLLYPLCTALLHKCTATALHCTTVPSLHCTIELYFFHYTALYFCTVVLHLHCTITLYFCNVLLPLPLRCTLEWRIEGPGWINLLL